jgi:high-affinity iron transporter
MLATLVIGLREGLEASLIVGIIAAFLRRSGKPLRPMWIGVGIAVALSIAVGVGLQLVSASLPQAAQEAMESIIGFVAVAIVTGMIGWMNVHARNLRHDLEHHAAEALRDGTAWALAGMAFLAVLKEGFETSVFLLAAFQASTSVIAASAGAVLGIAIAIGIGIGIYRGGVRLNLGRFFRITGVFLVFVAAGLVLASLRSAHEAGWIVIGQQRTVDLSWLAPAGSVQAALFTGVLGIPADPRVVEVTGWLAYLIPALLYLLWPARLRPTGQRLLAVRAGVAGVLVLTAATLAIALPLPSYRPAATVPIVATNGDRGTATLTRHGEDLAFANTLASDGGLAGIDPSRQALGQHDGVPAQSFSARISDAPINEPTSLTLTQLAAMNGGRLPIGMSATGSPGPFAVTWSRQSTTTIWVYNAGFVDANTTSTTIATLTGGGLASSRTLTPASAQLPGWRMAASARAAAARGIAAARDSSTELLLWKLWVPAALVLAALILLGFSLRPRFITAPRTRENYA